MMDPYAISCGAIQNKEKQDSLSLQEEQAIFLENKFCKSFCFITDLTTSQELISYALKAINFYSKKHYQLSGQLPIMSIEWET